MNPILNLSPQAVWKNFVALNAIPRPSKKEEQVRQFMIDFGKRRNLPVTTDEVGNVLITKSATPGMGNRKKVVLQAHLDMVCQKNNDVTFDFEKQGIDMYVAEGFVRAKGTTLGADNGIGVAAIMAVLESEDIPHPALEAFFTIDEETGMTGAKGLKADFLSGEILLNLDTEEDDELDIGCAGGVDVTAEKTYLETPVADAVAFEIAVKGLQGGHSGMQIHEGLGNANKLLGRLLDAGQEQELRIVSIDSGGLRNAIPREGVARIVVPTSMEADFRKDFMKRQQEILQEYRTLEPKLDISLTKSEPCTSAMAESDTRIFCRALLATFNGVFRMSPDMPDLVETSNNTARVVVGQGKIEVACLTRSSIASGKWNLARSLQAVWELAGCSVTFSGDYPGWAPDPESAILSLAQRIYKEKFGAAPNVVACHAGLECGLIGQHYPDLDMISFGPNIYGAHSPDEKVEIASVDKFWELLQAILQQIPEA